MMKNNKETTKEYDEKATTEQEAKPPKRATVHSMEVAKLKSVGVLLSKLFGA